MEILDLTRGTVDGIATVGNWIFFVVVGIFAFWVASKFFTNLKPLRGEG
jgi:hypothetical protein